MKKIARPKAQSVQTTKNAKMKSETKIFINDIEPS